jgi:hypothetical protein
MSAPAAKRNNRQVKSSKPVAVAASVLPAPVDGRSGAFDVPELDLEELSRLAYSFWEARHCQGGSPEEDWLRAKQKLRR